MKFGPPFGSQRVETRLRFPPPSDQQQRFDQRGGVSPDIKVVKVRPDRPRPSKQKAFAEEPWMAAGSGAVHLANGGRKFYAEKKARYQWQKEFSSRENQAGKITDETKARLAPRKKKHSATTHGPVDCFLDVISARSSLFPEGMATPGRREPLSEARPARCHGRRKIGRGGTPLSYNFSKIFQLFMGSIGL